MATVTPVFDDNNGNFFKFAFDNECHFFHENDIRWQQ